MKRQALASSIAPAAALLVCTACSGGPSHTRPAATPSTAASRTTTAPKGPFTLGRGQGFDASGAFISLMTCASPHDYSPGLTIANVPAGTAQLALSMVDLENRKIQWLQVNIPATTRKLKAHTLTPGARELLNDLGEATYDGPCPSPGHTHQYRLTLYALHNALRKSFGENSSPRQILAELQSRADATAVLVAPYTRH